MKIPYICIVFGDYHKKPFKDLLEIWRKVRI